MIRIIETMPNGALSLIVLLIVLAYLVVTGLLVRKQPKFLWIPVLILLVSSTSFYWYAYGIGGVQDMFSRLFMSFTAALDLFLFKMNSTYGRFTDLFYSYGDSINIASSNRLAILVSFYICSIWTTSILVMHFFARRLSSRILMAWKRFTAGNRGIHLFLGTNQESLALAKSLGKDAKVVFVDMPSGDVLPQKVSFLQFFQGLRTPLDRMEGVKDLLPHATVLKARKPLNRCTGKDLLQELGLGQLKHWVQRPDTTVFLLSGSYKENMTVLQKLSAYPAQIYCHGQRDGLAQRQELMENGHIHIIDSSFLATNALKSREELYPVRLMNVAKDAQGQPLGYVEGAFNALICGFGEDGQGMLSFLYEFGAFPDKDKQLNRFHCQVVDARMSLLEGEYKTTHPGILPERVSFLEQIVGSEAFWKSLKGSIQDLNYVFISVGDDDQNMKSALDFLEFAFRNRTRMDDFLVVVRLDHPARYRKMLEYYNQNFGGKATIQTIGDIESTWIWDNISGEEYRKTAQTFYRSYARASASTQNWEERNRRIMEKENVSDLARKLELQRKTQQDFANYFHVRVKRYLCPEWLWQDSSIAACIPLNMVDGKHFTGDNPQAEQILEYLAVGEHIRWMCSHQINGYSCGEILQEDLRIHPDIKAYELLEEPVKHYDWVVVKTTLEVLGKLFPTSA